MTFEWNAEDVTKVFASMLQPGAECYKFFDLPNSNYASSTFDKVTMGGKIVGFSMFGGYSFNERTALSLGVRVDSNINTGDVLTVTWGEEGGGTTERHRRAP